MANQYTVNTLVRLSANFKNSSDVDTDPTTVVFRYRIGETGSTTTYTYPTDVQVVRDSVGNFHIELTPIIADSLYYYSFHGTGTLIASKQDYFITKISYFD